MQNICYDCLQNINEFKNLFNSKCKDLKCDCCGNTKKCISFDDLISFIKGDLENEYCNFDEIGTEEWENRGDEVVSSEELLNNRYLGFENINEELRNAIIEKMPYESWIKDLSKID